MKLKVKENQSILDVVSQSLGSLEAAFAFCLVNEVSISEDLSSGQFVEIPDSPDKNVDVLNYFSAQEQELASGFPLTEDLSGGIGVMIIEQTFIVT